ncbi:MAG: DEAD/DEAH box helicase, partial [Clostridiaceae bacterium]
MVDKNEKIHLGSYAEDLFLEIFCETFGPEKSNYLGIQYPFVDIYGKHRNIDFALESNGTKIAIEIDGETYHDPSKISSEKYYDDLLKQNSLVSDNWKIYRWAYSQLKSQRDKIKDQLITFLGEYPLFNEFEDSLPSQRGQVIKLKNHQEEALNNLKNMRENNESIALLYHATGTGKTITAVMDAKSIGKRTLFIAHTKELVRQAKREFNKAWSEVAAGIYMGEEKNLDSFVVCSSIQSLVSHIDEFDPKDFGYIIIDEAHHGSAESYKKILSYFKPDFILGLTATPERMDGEDILGMFKNVAHKLDLKRAIELGELVPIRCIRIKTNIDISEVKINGIKYNSQDLESKLFIPERNIVIVKTYLDFVRDKKCVVFCASINHANEIAKIFKEAGIRAEAVSGYTKDEDRKTILENYENGDINVLCACDLLNEGWDSPKTEVLFMARPTMSKTIYMQQLGRGTRKSEGKEYLMVFDFIDNANIFNQAYSLHRMFNIDKYEPAAFVLASKEKMEKDELLRRRGEKPDAYLDLPVDVFDYEIIDLFNWQDKVKDMISQIEFVRMVDIQGETLSRYIKDGKIKPDLEIPMNKTSFKYFYEESVKKYAKEFGWEIINASNMKDKFMEMVRTMDMSYSYKPVLLKAMLECTDDKGQVKLNNVIDYFIDFYEDRKKRGLEAEKKKCIYNNEIIYRKEVERNILSNPFKRFEDMRFMEKCKDIEYIRFNQNIWRKLGREDKVWIEEWCDERIRRYYG